MPPQPQRKSRRKPTPPPRRIAIRLGVALIVVVVFGALWLIDTGALLQLTRAEMREYPRVAIGIAAAFTLLITASIWRAKHRKAKPKPRARAKPATKRAKPSGHGANPATPNGDDRPGHDGPP